MITFLQVFWLKFFMHECNLSHQIPFDLIILIFGKLCRSLWNFINPPVTSTLLANRDCLFLLFSRGREVTILKLCYGLSNTFLSKMICLLQCNDSCYNEIQKCYSCIQSMMKGVRREASLTSSNIVWKWLCLPGRKVLKLYDQLYGKSTYRSWTSNLCSMFS
jgi:hypothetical protein